MPTFTPPTVNATPLAPPGTRGVEARLFRHYRPLKKGVSVIQRQDGTWYTKEYPNQDELTAALRYYLGGHIYTITQEDADALTAGGFGALVT